MGVRPLPRSQYPIRCGLTFTSSPVVDGDFVRELPELELSAGNVAKGIDTLIVSHTLDEASMFVPRTVNSGVIDSVIDHYFSSYSPTANAIKERYLSSPSYKDDRARMRDLYQFMTFTCHARWIAEHFPGKTYSMQYSRNGGLHGSDIMADFYPGIKPGFTAYLSGMNDKNIASFAPSFQAYLLSHARTGDPNTFKAADAPLWPKVTMGSTMTNVLNVTDKAQPYELVADEVTKAEDCDFWKEQLAAMTKELA
jgi:Carboxylesterase family